MTQRKYILFVALVFTGSFAIGQGYKPVPEDLGKFVNENKKWGAKAEKPTLQYKYSSKSRQLKPVHINLELPEKQTEITPLSHYLLQPVSTESSQASFNMVHSSSYYDQLGFFCRKEIQLQKVTTVPVKFRLGSYDYVNWLEGKDRHE